MIQYRRGAHLVEAVRFDGTAASVAALGAFGCRREGEGDDTMAVPTPCGLVFIGAGLWVLRDHGSLSVVDDDTLASFYDPVLPPYRGDALSC